MMKRILLTIVCVGICEAAFGAAKQPKQVVWPNASSKANSSEWLIKNHDKITLLQPRVLVLNFSNNQTREQGLAKVNRIIEAVRESSRYHGYKNPKAPVTLDYKIAKFVDLADRPADPRPEGERFEGNSTKYPRVPNWKRGINFSYARLFSDEFAEYYGWKDPKKPGRYLTLKELVNQGIVNEVWFLALQGNYGAPFESVEVKQVYDENFKKVPGKWTQAGNGGSPEQPWIGRSLRIGFINSDRGPGCFLESLSHSFEGMAHYNPIPYFRKYFYEFAGFDLNTRWGLKSNSLYGHGDDPVDYPKPDVMTLKNDGQPMTIENFYAIGGNVHYNPSGRRDYDLDNPQPVMSTIENYRLFNGPDGKDKKELWTVAKFKKYNPLADDCMGPWLVYWRQNMPGPHSPMKDDNGKPMKCWWPFLFY
ncbi:MAG: hypothetical protein GYA63_10595 [Armatimonadetes bacterium]|nr:hypothetical protein [Armatimonadota bacterium]